jgi:hypothetical protein
MSSMQMFNLYNNFLTGTIPSQMSLLTNLYHLELQTNYLTMGSETTVPSSTFSYATQSGLLGLQNNCLAYTSATYPSQSTTATHCKPTSGKKRFVMYPLVLLQC